ncbi:MAG: hypothetical protein ACM3X6_00110, partial [Patescibacteria group bacterium]
MKRIVRAYRDILTIMFAEAPLMVMGVFAAALLYGAINSASVWLNGRVFDTALGIARGVMAFGAIIPYLVAFIFVGVLPILLNDLFIYSYVEARAQLILRSSYKGKMIQKLKRLKYEHIESEQSAEIIDKAYNRVENAVRHLFPMYLVNVCASLTGSLGLLYLFA